MDQPNKLKKFEDAVLSEIDMKTALMRAEAEERHKSELEESKDAQLARAYSEIQKKISDIRKASKREVAKHSLQSKREILQKRNSLMKSVFESASAKLSAYTATDKYLKRMLEKLAFYAAEYKLEDAQIFVCEQDYKHSKEFSDAYGLPCTILADKTNTLGGFILKSHAASYYFDETLETLLSSQKDYFIENSGLAL